ncbi:hypothetical protein [Streptomyces triculaminicus]|uniref:hypothetical protein n=1 Tax=Streptomyces triculaminicus TaxID=2816232 RepID=UPI0037CD3173
MMVRNADEGGDDHADEERRRGQGSARTDWETARLLAGKGDTAIVHAPDQASGGDAVTRLAAAGVDVLRLRLVVAGFSRFSRLDEVRAMAVRIAGEHPVLDILVDLRPYVPLPGRLRRSFPHPTPVRVWELPAETSVCPAGRTGT